MNRVTWICGGRVMVTLNEHVARCVPASVAAQVTGVTPAEKLEPDAGVHETWTGAVPPAEAGVVHVMATG
jgi:hypothetical protein